MNFKINKCFSMCRFNKGFQARKIRQKKLKSQFFLDGIIIYKMDAL